MSQLHHLKAPNPDGQSKKTVDDVDAGVRKCNFFNFI